MPIDVDSGQWGGIGLPEKVHRRGHKRHRRRPCRDERHYVSCDFTIPGLLDVGSYEPMRRMDRDYYIARIIATCGRHDPDTHPDDGCPTGQAIKINVRRVTTDLATDQPILSTDDVLDIDAGTHRDVSGDDEADYNILTLDRNEFIYVKVIQVGSTYAGRNLVVTVVLVPVP